MVCTTGVGSFFVGESLNLSDVEVVLFFFW